MHWSHWAPITGNLLMFPTLKKNVAPHSISICENSSLTANVQSLRMNKFVIPLKPEKQALAPMKLSVFCISFWLIEKYKHQTLEYRLPIAQDFTWTNTFYGILHGESTTGRCKHIELKFMIKGHTHSIVDGALSQMKKELRRSDVFCLDNFRHVINQSASTNRACVVNGDNVYDWKNGLCPYFKEWKDISQFQDLK